jgi:hypothetical protein
VLKENNAVGAQGCKMTAALLTVHGAELQTFASKINLFFLYRI